VTQVYQFVDDNGVTRLFAEIVPDPAGTPFNGGTITSPLEIVAPTHNGTPVFHVFNDLAVEGFIVSDNGSLTLLGDLNSNATTTLGGVGNAVQLYVIAGSAQASPISQVFDALGNTAFQLDKVGRVVIAVHSAPADGDLAAGECALWFDQTDGAGKLMVKAKTANGTVATAAIALA
jgi:hypothetical protein